MNTLFEIANLNAIYIDAADRDDVADKIYLKNQDKVCGVVVDEYSNLRKKHNHFTACMIVLQNLGIPAYFVDVD